MPDSNHNAIEASLHVGEAELTPKPKVAAKVIKINDRAEAARAPAMIGVHCKLQRPVSPEARERPSPVTGASKVIGSLLSQTEEGQYRQNNDNQTYEIDCAIHIALSLHITGCVIS